MQRLIITTLVAILLAGCTETEPPYSALDRLLTVFQGGHTKQQIKSRLDEAFRIYEVPITEENYIRYGSILVSLRRGAGTGGASEMEILDHAIRAYTPEVKLEEMMPLSSLMLQSEEQRKLRKQDGM